MADLLNDRVTKVINRETLSVRLQSGEKLRVYIGYDITSPELHIGSAVGLLKLQEFAEAGHEAVLLFGDFTTSIGDPSGHDKSRPMLDETAIKANIKGWRSQVRRFIDLKKIEIRRNSEWHGKHKEIELLRSAGYFSAADIWERDLYRERLKSGGGLTLREFLYPLLQAMDAVALKADIQIGGEDQEFNILRSRELVRKVLNKDQHMVLVPLLPGTDGRKMSKSWGNTINVTEPPNAMFGELMRIPDSIIEAYTKALVPGATLAIVSQIQAEPMEAKLSLAEQVTALFHNEAKARRARQEFLKIFRHRERPSEIEKKRLERQEFQAVSDLLLACELVQSKSEARRLIEQGGVTINDAPVSRDEPVEVTRGTVIQVGPRRFVEIA